MSRVSTDETLSTNSESGWYSARSAIAMLVLVAAILAVFGRSVAQNQFVNWDDQIQIYLNPDFNPPTPASVLKYWYSPHMQLYMPITYTVWGTVSAIARRSPDAAGIALDPAYFHGLNLLFHIASTLVVFALARRLGFGPWPAFAGAALFGLHPIQTEAVCWVSGFYTVLSGFLMFLCLYQYIQYARKKSAGSDRSARRHYIMATVWFVIAMLAKPSAMTVVFMAGAIDVILIRRSFTSAVRALALWVALAAPFIGILHFTQPAPVVPDQPIWVRGWVFLDAIGFYGLKLLLPARFALDYGRNPPWLRAHPGAIWMAGLGAMMLITAWMTRRKLPWLSVGVALIVTGSLPFLGLMKFDFQHFSTVADRYVYPGVLGLALLAAALLRAANHLAVRIAAILALAGLAIHTFLLTGVWKDSEALFNHNLQLNPTSLAANGDLGFLAMRQGDVDDAIRLYHQALATDPDDVDVNNDLANALMTRGDYSNAIEHYRRALQGTPDDPRIHNNLGSALADEKDYAGATEEFQTAIAEVEPDTVQDRTARAEAHTNLGMILEKQSRPADAEAHYRAALELVPNYGPAQEALARLIIADQARPTAPATP